MGAHWIDGRQPRAPRADATEVARRLGSIVLVNGEEFTRLMLDNGVRVTTAMVYEVKRIDKNHLDQE